MSYNVKLGDGLTAPTPVIDPSDDLAADHPADARHHHYQRRDAQLLGEGLPPQHHGVEDYEYPLEYGPREGRVQEQPIHREGLSVAEEGQEDRETLSPASLGPKVGRRV